MNANSLHPTQEDFLPTLSKVVPESFAAFLFALGAASSSQWREGGLMVEAVQASETITWRPAKAATRNELLEFFACVCGNRSLERLHEAEPVLTAFERMAQHAFPQASVHLEVEPYERSWCYRLHALVNRATDQGPLYISLFWSVD